MGLWFRDEYWGTIVAVSRFGESERLESQKRPFLGHYPTQDDASCVTKPFRLTNTGRFDLCTLRNAQKLP